MNMLLAMSSNYSRSAQPYVAKVCWSFVDGQNYQLGWLHTECGFPFCLGILSIRQRVAQTVFSLPRNHRTLFLRPTHCLEELLFACKWGVQRTIKDHRLHKTNVANTYSRSGLLKLFRQWHRHNTSVSFGRSSIQFGLQASGELTFNLLFF